MAEEAELAVLGVESVDDALGAAVSSKAVTRVPFESREHPGNC